MSPLASMLREGWSDRNLELPASLISLQQAAVLGTLTENSLASRSSQIHCRGSSLQIHALGVSLWKGMGIHLKRGSTATSISGMEIPTKDHSREDGAWNVGCCLHNSPWPFANSLTKQRGIFLPLWEKGRMMVFCSPGNHGDWAFSGCLWNIL